MARLNRLAITSTALLAGSASLFVGLSAIADAPTTTSNIDEHETVVTSAPFTEADRAELRERRAPEAADAPPAQPIDAPLTPQGAFLRDLERADPESLKDGVPVAATLIYSSEQSENERAAALAEVKAFLESGGGTFETYFKFGHVVYATVPRSLIDTLSGHVHVDYLSWRRIGGLIKYSYTGDQIRNAILANEFISSGFDAENGHKNDHTKPVRVAVIEVSDDAYPNLPHRHHVGWQDTPGGSSRIKTVKICRVSNGCITTTQTVTLPTQHGSMVSWHIGGSIEQGQDSALPGSNTLEQRHRSGVAREVEIRYYAMHPANLTGC